MLQCCCFVIQLSEKKMEKKSLSDGRWIIMGYLAGSFTVVVGRCRMLLSNTEHCIAPTNL